MSISASSGRSLTSNFHLLFAVLQFVEAVNMKRVDMSTSRVIGGVAGFFQGRKYISLEVVDSSELGVSEASFWLVLLLVADEAVGFVRVECEEGGRGEWGGGNCHRALHCSLHHPRAVCSPTVDGFF